MKDYYAILGVRRTASILEIKQAYRKLAILYHPDKNPDPVAEQFFKEVNEAYDVLGDEAKKNWYDFKFYAPPLSASPPPESPPSHRDPAYRRRRPHVVTPQNNRISIWEIIHEYLPYFSWTSWAGIALTGILALDYLLPTTTSTEEVLELNGVGLYEIMVTSHHRIIIEGESALEEFQVGAQVDVTFTPCLRTVLEVSDPTTNSIIFLRGIYGPVFILPFVLFITSGLGIISRKNKMDFFNLSIVNGILILAIIYLIFNV